MSTVDRRGAPNPAGTVAVYSSETSGQFASLFRNLNNLVVPEGTVKRFETGDRCEALNNLVKGALEDNSYWVWFITAEHGFDSEMLTRLISRNVVIACPIVLEDVEPFLPMAWSDVEKGVTTPFLLGSVTGPASLIEVRGANMTGMLVRKAVFDTLAYPWFRAVDGVPEDVYFCERARDFGFSIQLDTSSRLSTFSVSSLMPTHKGDQWEMDVSVGKNINLSIPLRHR